MVRAEHRVAIRAGLCNSAGQGRGSRGRDQGGPIRLGRRVQQPPSGDDVGQQGRVNAMKDWHKVKDEIEDEIDRIWWEEPEEVTMSKLGIFPGGAGVGNQIFG